jgi:hypothetical protein
MKFGFEYSALGHGFDFIVHVMIMAPDFEHNHHPIYMFDICSEGFRHMFGEIQEYPSIEYVDKINEDDNDEGQEGRLRIIGVDIL